MAAVLIGTAVTRAQSLVPKANEKGKYGYVSQDGAQVVPYIYEEAYPFKNGAAKVCKGKKYGFIDEQGNEIVKPFFDQVAPFKNGAAYTRVGKNYGFVSDKGEIILPALYAAVGTFNESGFTWVNEGGKVDKEGRLTGGKYGIVSLTGNMIVPALYKAVGTFGKDEENEAYIYRSAFDSRRDYKPFDTLSPSEVPYFWFSKNPDGRDAGITGADGQVLVPADTYAAVYPPTDGMARVLFFDKKNGSEGFYNIHTKKLLTVKTIDREADEVPAIVFYAYENGVSKVMDNKVYYFIDTEGAKVTADYDYVGNFQNGLCVAGKDGVFGAIDNTGKSVIPFEFEDLGTAFSEGVLAARKNGKWGFIDPAGAEAIPFMYDGVTRFHFGWAVVQLDGLWGMIDHANTVTVPVRFEDVQMLSEKEPRYVWVKQNGLWHCYDRPADCLAFERGYINVTAFTGGVAYVHANTGYGMVTRTGAEVIPCRLASFGEAEAAYAYMQKEHKDGLTATDLFRLELYKNDDRNKYRLTDVIPEENWDY